MFASNDEAVKAALDGRLLLLATDGVTEAGVAVVGDNRPFVDDAVEEMGVVAAAAVVVVDSGVGGAEMGVVGIPDVSLLSLF